MPLHVYLLTWLPFALSVVAVAFHWKMFIKNNRAKYGKHGANWPSFIVNIVHLAIVNIVVYGIIIKNHAYIAPFDFLHSLFF